MAGDVKHDTRHIVFVVVEDNVCNYAFCVIDFYIIRKLCFLII